LNNMNDQYSDLSDMAITDTWTVAEFDIDGKLLVIRIRTHLHSLVGHPQLPHRLRIIWEYQSGNEAGLPNSDDLEAMHCCEEDLFSILERDNHGVLTHTLMGDGLRQWVFYCSDLDEVAQRINETLPANPPYPLDFENEADVAWIEYLETLQAVETSQA
jgi:hypothetical protein